MQASRAQEGRGNKRVANSTYKELGYALCMTSRFTIEIEYDVNPGMGAD